MAAAFLAAAVLLALRYSTHLGLHTVMLAVLLVLCEMGASLQLHYISKINERVYNEMGMPSLLCTTAVAVPLYSRGGVLSQHLATPQQHVKNPAIHYGKQQVSECGLPGRSHKLAGVQRGESGQSEALFIMYFGCYECESCLSSHSGCTVEGVAPFRFNLACELPKRSSLARGYPGFGFHRETRTLVRDQTAT